MSSQLLLPIVLFAALIIMMVFGMRRQKRQVAETQRLQNSLTLGTRVMTTSGLHGTITAVADDTLELEIAPGVRTTWVKAAVREVVVAGPVIDADPDYAPELDAAADSDLDADSPEISPGSSTSSSGTSEVG